MMKWLNAFILLGIFQNSILAQHSINFNKSEHNFGQVANLNYPPAVFTFTNTGKKDLAVLMVNKPKSVKVSYPTTYIKPGESGKLLVLPDLNKIGVFSEKISVVTNNNPEPVTLNISGEVISIQACFPDPDNWNIRKIMVIDKDTKGPIPEATIYLTHNMSRKFEGKTDEKGMWEGEMPIGQYNFQIAATHYYPLKQDKFVPRSLPLLFFELDRIPPEVPKEQISINEPNIEPGEVDFSVTPVDIPDNTRLLPTNLYAANNIVLLLDVSYSMKSNRKLELLKQSANNLTDILRDIDNVSVIAYSGSPRLIIKSIPGNKKDEIKSKINGLTASGITMGVKGLESAYDIANVNFKVSGNNQIILATDGKFTGGSQQPEEFQNMIASYASKGIILSIIGFGVDEEAKKFMNEMSLLGKGSYIHISTKDDVSETLINEIKQKSYLR